MCRTTGTADARPATTAEPAADPVPRLERAFAVLGRTRVRPVPNEAQRGILDPLRARSP
jgi:hypothetical protein